jgi:hypothetical protein
MIVGNPGVFAIESAITNAYERLSFRALGFFVIHVGGRRYGVHKPDATMLACSFDAVERRLSRRGMHTAPFAAEPDAGRIADAFRDACYAGICPQEGYFGMCEAEFCKLFDWDSSRELLWAPDGDEAFDDGSYVLQFDVADRVRVIAFRSVEGGYPHDPSTLNDVWLNDGTFYDVLQRWRDAFEAAWRIAPKVSEDVPPSRDGP